MPRMNYPGIDQRHLDLAEGFLGSDRLKGLRQGRAGRLGTSPTQAPGPVAPSPYLPVEPTPRQRPTSRLTAGATPFLPVESPATRAAQRSRPSRPEPRTPVPDSEEIRARRMAQLEDWRAMTREERLEWARQRVQEVLAWLRARRESAMASRGIAPASRPQPFPLGGPSPGPVPFPLSPGGRLPGR